MIKLYSRLLTTGLVAASIAVGGLASTAPTAQAMPAKPIGLNEGAPSMVETVAQRRRVVRARRGGNAAAAAIGLGILGLGAAIAANQQRDYYYSDRYYDPGYGYYGPRRYYGPQRHYGQGYGYAPRQRFYPGPYATGPRNYGGGRYGQQWGYPQGGGGAHPNQPDSGGR